ncbi:hypothetical protein DL239_15095 [Sedimentitalea sp. CY04]|uniref:Uncharacterized protein n=1 Tax=Parasedimentitalea denitrificans TaxID=2211118 RepID=A0ABX0WC94_9RHOB|nr:hypothetical protein [Sedimentitalea sp. CY04]
MAFKFLVCGGCFKRSANTDQTPRKVLTIGGITGRQRGCKSSLLKLVFISQNWMNDVINLYAVAKKIELGFVSAGHHLMGITI